MPEVSPILAALYRGDRPEAEVLARDSELDVYEAAALGQVTGVQAALRERPELAQATNTDGFTALHLAAFFSGGAETALVLLEAGADPGAVAANDTGLHPINSAAAVANNEVVAMLVERGADVDATQRGGFTALHAAAAAGNDDLVSYLIEAGADPSRQTEDGATAASLAQERGHAETARLIAG